MFTAEKRCSGTFGTGQKTQQKQQVFQPVFNACCRGVYYALNSKNVLGKRWSGSLRAQNLCQTIKHSIGKILWTHFPSKERPQNCIGIEKKGSGIPGSPKPELTNKKNNALG